MLSRYHGVLMACVLCALALPVQADVAFSTHQGALNPEGQPVAARMEFSVSPDTLTVRVTNTTQDIKNFSQVLRAVSFQINGRPAEGELIVSRGQVRTFTADGMSTRPESEDTRWTLVKSGGTYVLKSPGIERTVLPDANDDAYRYADESITLPGGHEFLAGPVTFQIRIPGIGLTEDMVNVRFHWGKDDGTEGMDLKVTQPRTAPDPSQMFKVDRGTPGEASLVPSQRPGTDVIPSSHAGLLPPLEENAGYIWHDVRPGEPIDEGRWASGSQALASWPQEETPFDYKLDPSGKTANTKPDISPLPSNLPSVDDTSGLVPPTGTAANPKPTIDPTVNNPPTTTLPVPEPATAGILGLGALGLLTAFRRPRR